MEGIKVDYDTTQYIVIKLGQEQYGIDIKYIDNIVRMQSITRVPKVAPYIKGVINFRGEVIPGISIRMKVDLPEDEDQKNTRIIILKLEQYGTLGIIVDEVKEVVNLAEEEIEKMVYDPKDEKAGYLFGIGKYDGELISLLDLNVALSVKENS